MLYVSLELISKLDNDKRSWAFLVAQLVKNSPAMQETQVRSLGWEDPLEKGTATLSSILGFPWWLSWSRIHLQCGRPGCNPCFGKISWRRERLLSPVFWPGEFHGLYSPRGHTQSGTTEWLSLDREVSSISMGWLGFRANSHLKYIFVNKVLLTQRHIHFSVSF